MSISRAVTGSGTEPEAAQARAARGARRHAPRRALLWIMILLVTLGVRLPAALAGRPYISYADEGNYLHRVIHLLAGGGWDTGMYLYPTLPMYCVAGVAVLYDPIYRATHHRPLVRDLSPDPTVDYDLLEPPEILYIGRAFALALSLGIVVLTGVLARRLAGPPAGLFAAWLAALTPALVIRGGIANVDIFATFFVLTALLATETLRESSPGTHPARAAVLAGGFTALAAISKYTCALVCLPLALAILLSRRSWGRKLRLLALAGATAALTAILGMPALVLRTSQVLHDLATQSFLYSTLKLGSYWEQAFERAEWDQPLDTPELGFAYAAFAALGLLLAIGAANRGDGSPGTDPAAGRRRARAAAGWLLFGGALGALLAPYSFRPFRNLLPLVPLLAVLTAFVYCWLRGVPGRGGPAGQGRGARLAIDFAAVLLPLALFAPALYAYDDERLAVEDSRTLARHWLAAHAGAGDSVLVSSELMFLSCQLKTLPAPVSVSSWTPWRKAMRTGENRFIVLGNFALPGPRLIPRRVWRNILARYELRATFGQRAVITSDSSYNSRTNFQPIFLLERRPAPAPP